jgi:hypothetical protein
MKEAEFWSQETTTIRLVGSRIKPDPTKQWMLDFVGKGVAHVLVVKWSKAKL